ncbi:MAG: Cell division protein FtsI/penicillin-binding protein 2 [Acidobacteria bacterium]|nr:Cell division protein FtsI/penicillin-binding protein 2 [Acidobacteriota bacterium]
MRFNNSIFKSVCVVFTLVISFTAVCSKPVNAGGHPGRKPERSSRRGQSPAREPRKTKPAERRLTSAGREVPGPRNSASKRQTANRSVLKRQRAAEMRRIEARRHAEAVRLAAIAQQRALDEAMRSEVQTFIGRDNTTGEDADVRRAAVNALGSHAGTVVVMDPGTGRVYSIVNQEWALRRGFKPCSTIKLVTGLAGLNENVIDPSDTTKISDSNRMSLTDALAHSNNTYFQQVGGRVGYDKMVSYARRLGLGEKTGINAPNESPGQMPSPRSGYAVNHMSSHGDDFKVTAVQLATLVSAMANGGKLLAPNTPRDSRDTKEFKTKVRRIVNLDLDTLRYMVPGMVGAVNYGSGRRAQNPQETVAGKTGTCIEQGTWIGLFASYAPLVNPRLAVVVIARGADAHSHFPAAVAGRIYRDLNSRFGTPTNLQIAAAHAGNGGGLNSDPKVSLNEEDTEEDAENVEALDAASGNQATRGTTRSANMLETSMTNVTSAQMPHAAQPLWRDTRTPASSTVKRVLMPIPNRPVDVRAVVAKPAPRPSAQSQTRPRRVSDIQR